MTNTGPIFGGHRRHRASIQGHRSTRWL